MSEPATKTEVRLTAFVVIVVIFLLLTFQNVLFHGLIQEAIERIEAMRPCSQVEGK